jgi:putative tryptophan/tyrosine transport system substrate-binding protein
MMNRRRFLLTSMAGAVAAPFNAGAEEPGRAYRLGYTLMPAGASSEHQQRSTLIGYLTGNTASASARVLDALRQGLRELGYQEGKNLQIHYGFGEGSPQRLAELAAEVVGLNVDVIVASAAGVGAARKATSSIPIVFLSITDPVGAGVVTNLARPGGNMTGFSYMGVELNPKRLGLLSEAVPGATRVAALVDPKHSLYHRMVEDLRSAAATNGARLQIIDVPQGRELEDAFAEMIAGRAQALLVLQAARFVFERKRIVSLAARNRIPAMYELWDFPEVGGLMSYAADLAHQFRRAATYVDKILKGTKPGDLPVEQPTQFELVINMKTAKTLGLTIPPSLLARADHVIE